MQWGVLVFLGSLCLELICLIYICNFLYISPRLYKHFLLHPSKAQCHFFINVKVDGGQLESLCYFDYHTHFITHTVIIISCNHVL